MSTFARRAGLAFALGSIMGGVYWALDVTSPAPPLIGLTGLLGIVAGERAGAFVLGGLRTPEEPERD
ncbi:XapX domain-containing protein [Actinocorallia herbida]|uniref:XapX domain-containing protein n=1 Tax=Actinocorallia herbida TaxID=58109 RepID=A0A3N1CY23_9ACTN|nr:DUF1427 family protein [Actinocorallia herbida]ROO86189.1 XapX domain-containing protein [Actinocorallia herbida]